MPKRYSRAEILQPWFEFFCLLSFMMACTKQPVIPTQTALWRISPPTVTSSPTDSPVLTQIETSTFEVTVCGPWSNQDQNDTVGFAIRQKYGEFRNYFFFDNSWIILTLGLKGQSGVVAVYRCNPIDSACLNGQNDHPLPGWQIYKPPCPGGLTLGPETSSSGKIQILGGCMLWFDVSTGTFSSQP